MRTTALLLLFAARRAAGDADKLFKGIPSACASNDDEVCCTYYPGARTTAVDDIVALSRLAYECDHHDWDSHRIDWCGGYEQNGRAARERERARERESLSRGSPHARPPERSRIPPSPAECMK